MPRTESGALPNPRWTDPRVVVGLIAAAGHFAAGPLDSQWLHWITKPIPVACLIALLPVWAPTRPDAPPDRYRLLLGLGLALSILGDVFMMLPGKFVQGLSSFLVAHLFYIAAFTTRGPSLDGAPGARPGFGPVRLLPFLAFAGSALAYLWTGLGEMLVPVVVYVGVILSMGWRASARVGLPGEARAAHVAGLLGAISFMISDTMIAVNKFRVPLPAQHELVMITYWLGQLGIAMSAARLGAPPSSEAAD